MNKNNFITNPKTQGLSYGTIPEISSKGLSFPNAPIYLRKGEHRGPNKGFGLEHIWAEHQKELFGLNYTRKEDVAKFVSDIIQPHMPLYCEFNNLRGNHRIGVIRNSLGVVYIELKYNARNEPFYSVVTAFTKAKAHGTLIGRVLADVMSSSSDSLALKGQNPPLHVLPEDFLGIFRPNEEANSK